MPREVRARRHDLILIHQVGKLHQMFGVIKNHYIVHIGIFGNYRLLERREHALSYSWGLSFFSTGELLLREWFVLVIIFAHGRGNSKECFLLDSL